MAASLILFMSSFFQKFLTSIKTNNLSLEFRVGKFRHNGLLGIFYGFVIPKIELK